MFTVEQIATLNTLEIELYNYIANNMEKVSYMRIRELADATHVSTTTILRFCKKIDCDGFSEFKVKLKLHMKEMKKPLLHDNTRFLDFMDRTNDPLFQENIETACTLIQQSDEVIFIGNGTSGVLASYGARYFSSLGKFALCIDDPYYPFAGKDGKKRLIIALSVTGECLSVLNIVNKLKQQGTDIITITSTMNSTLAKISDLCICHYSHIQYNGPYDVTSQLPVLHILELLGTTFHNKNKETASIRV